MASGFADVNWVNAAEQRRTAVHVACAAGHAAALECLLLNGGDMLTGGRNTGRVGTLVHIERHPGSFHIGHIKDSAGHTFATRLTNVFQIGNATRPWVSLPKGKGIKLSILEERSLRSNKGRA